jgi:hypothetical protein
MYETNYAALHGMIDVVVMAHNRTSSEGCARRRHLDAGRPVLAWRSDSLVLGKHGRCPPGDPATASRTVSPSVYRKDLRSGHSPDS